MSIMDSDDGQEIMALYITEIKRRLKEAPADFKAADFEHLRKLMQDNSITMASIRRGSYGDFAAKVAEDFPFPAGDEPKFQ